CYEAKKRQIRRSAKAAVERARDLTQRPNKLFSGMERSGQQSSQFFGRRHYLLGGGNEQFFFTFEVKIDRTLTDASLFRDIVERSLVQSATRKDLERRRGDFFRTVGCAPLPAGSANDCTCFS